jgi:hypothetical protein
MRARMPDPSAEEYLREAERRERRWTRVRVVGVVVGCVLVAAIGAYVSLNRVAVGDDRALEVLRASGLRNPRLGDAVTAACSESESSRRFTAINASGAPVEGTVCCGLTGVGKGCTIRWGR